MASTRMALRSRFPFVVESVRHQLVGLLEVARHYPDFHPLISRGTQNYKRCHVKLCECAFGNRNGSAFSGYTPSPLFGSRLCSYPVWGSSARQSAAIFTSDFSRLGKLA